MGNDVFAGSNLHENWKPNIKNTLFEFYYQYFKNTYITEADPAIWKGGLINKKHCVKFSIQ